MRRSSGSFRLDGNLIKDVLIAYLIVNFAPGLLNKYLFKDNPLTGAMLNVAGGGAAYLLGYMMKNNNIANLGIALAGAAFVEPMIGQALNQIAPANTTTPAKTVTAGMPTATAVKNISDYMRVPGFAAYITNSEASAMMPYDSYHTFYAGRN